MTTNTGKYKEEIWLNIENREFFPLSLKTRDVHVLNFFQFSLPPLSLSKAETTFSQLSNAKSLQNICCNRCSQSKDYSSFGRSAIASTFALSLSLEYWKVGRGGELLWFASGGGDNQPILSLLFSLPSKSACIPNQRGRCGKKQMYLSRAAPRAEDEGTLPVLSSSHVPTIVSPTTPSHSSHSLETQQNWKFQESLSWVVSFWWLVSKTIFPQRLSWVSGAPALHYSPELPVSPGQGGGYDRGGWSWRKEGVKIRWAVSR